MKLAKKTNLIAGLDLGSSKVCAVIGEFGSEGVCALGLGTAPAKGYKRGVVTSVSALVECISQSVQKAEEQARTSVESVFVTSGASPTPGINATGSSAIKNKAHEVTQEDIYLTTDAAKDCRIPDGMMVIHVLPQEFMLDGQAGISDPLGMVGEELGVRIHLMVNASTAVQNIVNAVNKSGLMVAGTVMPQLAAALAVLTEDERELGTMLIDIGGGSTDIGVFFKGSLWHSDSIPMGGSYFTKDISVGLRTPMGEAEALKKERGCAHPSLVALEQLLEVASIAGNGVRLISREMLCQVIQARAEELFGLISKKLQVWQCRRELVAGAVITGGMSSLEGMDVVAEEILGMPVRVGFAGSAFGMNEIAADPAFSAAAGLLVYASNSLNGRQNNVVRPAASAGLLESSSMKVRHWFQHLMA
ncbi:MAG: cell division protein FtsA [Acidobacteria bacterium]|nr:cell division protein FtsA [Acidobacteriota bacterium]